MATRWTEHDSPTHDFESAKHLNRHIQHSYNLITLTKASKNTRKRKNLLAIYIALLRLSLRDKLKFYKLLHFRNYKFSNHYNSYFWYLSRQSFYQMKKKKFFQLIFLFGDADTLLNPLQPRVAYIYPLKTSKNLKVF